MVALAGGRIGIGDKELPAPQAGLMAQLAQGIVGGEMAWGLILFGMFLAVALILIKAPAPMLIAVGMYLPFQTTFAIFIGGLLKAFVDHLLAKREASAAGKERAGSAGTLLASGFIAGEALTGVLLAGLVLGFQDTIKNFSLTQLVAGQNTFDFVHTAAGAWTSLLFFAVIAFVLIRFPLKRARSST